MQLYMEWYSLLLRHVSPALAIGGRVLEIGSGGGFLKEMEPRIITSEFLQVDGVDLQVDAMNIPFPDNSLAGIIMIDVLHHIWDTDAFFSEVDRVLQVGGRLTMLEPWNTPWSRFIFNNLHHEPFIPDSKNWAFSSSGPLSGANGALPWIIFSRDNILFQQKYPNLIVDNITLDYPFSYLVSGGVSMRQLTPGCLYKPIRKIERLLALWMQSIGTMAVIALRKVEPSGGGSGKIQG